MRIRLLLLFLLASPGLFSQKLKRDDKLTLSNLKTHIYYLSDDQLQGRRTGTAGEQLAYEYIIRMFETSGLQPKGENGYLQPFEVNDGKKIESSTTLKLNGTALIPETDFFPLPYTANGTVQTTVSPALPEKGLPWFFDISELIEKNKENPHYNLESALPDEINTMIQRGASAVILYNSVSEKQDLSFDPKNRQTSVTVPVVFIKYQAFRKHLSNISTTYDLQLATQVSEQKRYGHNVVGYINNEAPYTVVVGAHYDHLGYGEDKNSLYHGTDKLIHHGADDNASGTAALIEMSRILKQKKYRKSNYLLIAFSGEELGLYGSKYYTEHPTIDLTKVNYMINMDMVGRFHDSARSFTLGGFGTSPAWGNFISLNGEYVIKVDSSGTGPSDHTSFYRKNIPVLFFFTGTHSDYHKPSDVAEKINYEGETRLVKYISSLIDKVNRSGEKLAFTKTREPQQQRTSFSVSLGIMPDYTFSGSGVKVDGITENRPAQKAGIQVNDVIIQLGDYPVGSVESYMQALSKFRRGDKTKVKYQRGKETLESEVQF